MFHPKIDPRSVYDRTSGRCHICGKNLAFKNRGTIGARGAWEVDHSVPRARGGTQRLNNLLPACVSCNRSKQDGTTRAARALHGRTCKPMSMAERERARAKQAGLGAAIGAVGFLINPVVGLLTITAGLAVGAAIDPED